MSQLPRLLSILLVLASLPLAGADAAGQSLDIGIGATGILALQPTDDTYVGGPYLNEGIGGWGPGFGAFVNVIKNSGFTVAGEFTFSEYSAEQIGRLVGGPDDGRPSTRVLRQSLVSEYAGYTVREASLMASFLGGGSWVFEQMTFSGSETEHPLSPPLALGGGVDVAISMSPRLALVSSAKYTWLLGRHETQAFIGMRSHVIRLGVGLRVRVK